MRFKTKLFKRANQSEEDAAELNVNEAKHRRRQSPIEDSFEENEPPRTSRTGYRKAQFQVELEKKRKKLGRKLNWIICGLLAAIVLAYLFMIFVNF
ncbi:hypothetical protein JCM15457_188 [Liquorilactobacillus sucicola DSM 21376 = JCM 15457]|uniref:Uncharacterized protein n=1 Tax=Liquorilactobacillus sucicola DSM 21376 = JCM 15457 TaxID=1423806 RepID=A0A023CU16_9LACO|nr:hypothetical protein [Liquorilactobacillus sucicola]KRN05267.1 hypothetical protein FD15_GL001814 [Liquorilactobacillus sucicola DSM 21376 = JCM 15457]GAJ25328.1 hypothetical protein JCM15457_188 [Liquorilactobacillus sucicola DSM 21376 = JCM 15457]